MTKDGITYFYSIDDVLKPVPKSPEMLKIYLEVHGLKLLQFLIRIWAVRLCIFIFIEMLFNRLFHTIFTQSTQYSYSIVAKSSDPVDGNVNN